MILTQTVRKVLTASVGRTFASSLSKAKELNYDPIQESLLKERCFLVDENDNITGTETKRDCHLVKKGLPLHRAFSVFLFNKKGDLLLQKRSSNKITYPDVYTNSCCSHPIADVPGEEDGAIGIKRAAQRRLNYELGIPIESVPLEKLNYITRILYKDEGNGKWGEHELDYILFFQDDVKIKPNSNEISEISFVPRIEFDEYLPTIAPLSPWFRLIVNHRLRFWWDNLDNLEEIMDHEKITHLN